MNRDFEKDKPLSENIFLKTAEKKEPYNENDPIPIEPELPEGIIFKVQVGAFRNPIPQDHFNDFAPVMGERTGKGITRYTVGLFKSFSQADRAKEEIRSMGYRDAFVVAFRDGERISPTRARELLSEQGKAPLASTGEESEREQPKDKKDTGSKADKITSDTDQANLFYTVQVGAYSNPVDPREIGISPLEVKKSEDGLYKYSTGRFQKRDKAEKRRQELVEQGISDAFVTAYYQGKNISLARAETLEDAAGQGSTEGSAKTERSRSDDEERKPAEKTRFRVFVGEFEETIPADIANALLKLPNGAVSFDQKGNTMVVSSPRTSSWKEIERWRSDYREAGLQNTKPQAFRGGQKVPVEEARKGSE